MSHRGSARTAGALRGFTLIELLVVIAIIAILAAILFPVFAKVRDQAKQAACLTLLKEFAVAFAMYADDSGNRPPLHTSWYTLGQCDPLLPDDHPYHNRYVGYYDLLRKYFKKRYGAFNCPGDPNGCVASGLWRRAGLGGQTPDPDWPVKDTKVVYRTTGYGTWKCPCGLRASGGGYYWSLNEILEPKKAPYLWDAWFDFVDPGGTQLEVGESYGPDDDPDDKWNDKRRVAARHGGGFSILYFDGHVRHCTYKDPSTGRMRLPIYGVPWQKGAVP